MTFTTEEIMAIMWMLKASVVLGVAIIVVGVLSYKFLGGDEE